MTKDKISSQEIIDLVATKASVSKRAAEEFLKVMIATIEEALIAGDVVKIKGFGTFKLQWNEPRKSVNVQSGDEIILDGYYKVVFVPETTLKELVNEPFSHLESVQLSAGNEFVVPEVIDEVPLDPLRIFTEQASEIRDLLSEIQALSVVPTIDTVDETSLDEDISIASEALESEVVEMKYELVEFQEIEEQVESIDETEFVEQVQETEIVIPTVDPEVEKVPETEAAFEYELEPEIQIFVQEQLAAVDINPIAENSEISENTDIADEIEPLAADVIDDANVSELESSPFLVGLSSKRKNLRWLSISIVLLFLVGGVLLFMFYSPVKKMGEKTIAKAKTEITYLKENMSITDMANSISKLFVSEPKKIPITEIVVIPKDTNNSDTLKVLTVVKGVKPSTSVVAVDSLQWLFDHPRVYDEYIASEQINSGSRLTLMSLKYYGSKAFWVYIYEANEDRIEDPDHIQIGTLIRIPKLNPRLIDVSDKRCVQKAQELRDLYVQ